MREITWAAQLFIGVRGIGFFTMGFRIVERRSGSSAGVTRRTRGERCNGFDGTPADGWVKVFKGLSSVHVLETRRIAQLLS